MSAREHRGVARLTLDGVLTGLDRLRFRSQRADYYDYLAALLAGERGARTLREIFRADAERQGGRSLRGRMAQRWQRRLEQSGGDLQATWDGDFPDAELGLIRAAQCVGNEGLIQTLGDLARMLALLRRAAGILASLLWPALLSFGLVVAVVLAVPGFTVPRLLDTFAFVPPDYYGRRTQALLAFAAAVQAHATAGLVGFAGAGVLLAASFTHLRGRLRRILDRVLWWDVYRQVQALRFLSFLIVALGNEEEESIRLRNALLRQRAGASPWLADHVDRMLQRLDAGIMGIRTLDTGLFTAEQLWFAGDMVLARGLRPGLELARERIRRHILEKVARQAHALRWLLLLGGLAVLLGLVLWHYAVIDELRRALSLYFATSPGGLP